MGLVDMSLRELTEFFNVLGPAVAFALLMYFLLIRFEHRHQKERKEWLDASIAERQERAESRREDEAAMRATIDNMTRTIDARAAESNAAIMAMANAVSSSTAKQDAYFQIRPVKTRGAKHTSPHDKPKKAA